jgi:hypothetical protein
MRWRKTINNYKGENRMSVADEMGEKRGEGERQREKRHTFGF